MPSWEEIYRGQNQDEIVRLTKKVKELEETVANYEAMREGVMVRIADLEKQLEKERAEKAQLLYQLDRMRRR